MIAPSIDFLHLASTLISSLPSTPTDVDTTLLLQLEAVFGSMLTSALQLLDRREVVKVNLNNGRTVFQVTSSTGLPYTLHFTPPRPVSPTKDAQSPTRGTMNAADHHMDATMDPASPKTSTEHDTAQKPSDPAAGGNENPQVDPLSYVQAFQGMYCPCPGFAYNSLSGERNVFCKHLLAVVLAHQMGREVTTTISNEGVVGLLGLASSTPARHDERVKVE